LYPAYPQSTPLFGLSYRLLLYIPSNTSS
jgi:hypothetical protein